MNYYNTLEKNCEANLFKYIKNLTAGYQKIDTKFLAETVLGIAKSQSVILADIARTFDGKTSVKRAIDRLSRNLNDIDDAKLVSNYSKIAKSQLPENPYLILDDTDIAKPLSRKMECLGEVHDGSTGGITKGYKVCEVVGISKSGQPISLASNMYSHSEISFSSANEKTRETLKCAMKGIKNATILADRGFDNVKIMDYILKSEQNFIIRAKINRNVIWKGKTKNILEVAKNMKGKYNMRVNFKDGAVHLKASFVKIALPAFPGKTFNLVVAYGMRKDNEPFMLLTNKDVKGKMTCVKTMLDYLCRWKIEEYFKFKKGVFKFEKMRVQKFKALTTLNKILTTVVSYVLMLARKNTARMIITVGKPLSDKSYFLGYQIARGMKEIMRKFNSKILDFLYPPKQPKQYDFFHYIKYKNHARNFTKSA